MDGFWELNTAVNIFVQSLGSWLEIVMRFFTFLGEEQFFMLVMPAVYWCLDAGLGLRLGIILLTSNFLSGFFKLAFHTPRPYWVNPQVKAYVLEPSFGLPSGHSQNSASLWGRVAAASPQRRAKVTLVVLIGLIGLSRLYLGVHYWMDVLSGWALGGIILWVFLRLEKPAVAWAQKQAFKRLVSLAFLLSMALILVHALILASLGSWELPLTWIDNARLAGTEETLNPFSAAGSFSGAGTLFGLLAGAAWLRHIGGYSAAGSGWRVVARYLVGLAGIVVIWFGLDMVFPDGESIVALAFRYLRYALAGGWIAGMAPFLFIRFGWAMRPDKLQVPLPELVS